MAFGNNFGAFSEGLAQGRSIMMAKESHDRQSALAERQGSMGAGSSISGERGVMQAQPGQITPTPGAPMGGDATPTLQGMSSGMPGQTGASSGLWDRISSIFTQ